MLFNSLLIQIKIKKTSALYAYIAYHCIFVYIFEKPFLRRIYICKNIWILIVCYLFQKKYWSEAGQIC